MRALVQSSVMILELLPQSNCISVLLPQYQSTISPSQFECSESDSVVRSTKTKPSRVASIASASVWRVESVQANSPTSKQPDIQGFVTVCGKTEDSSMSYFRVSQSSTARTISQVCHPSEVHNRHVHLFLQRQLFAW